MRIRIGGWSVSGGRGARMGTKSAAVSCVITAIIFTIIAVATFFTSSIFGGKDLEITRDFDMARAPGGYGYNYTVTGTVKNVTADTLYNVEIKVTLDGDDADYLGEMPVESIDKLEPGEEWNFQSIGTDSDLFEYIDEIEYSHSSSGGWVEIGSEFEDMLMGIIFGVIALVLWLVAIVSIVKYKKNKNQDLGNTAAMGNGGTTVTGGGMTYNSPVVGTTPTAPVAPEVKKCPYCGSKVSSVDNKCSGCGARVE